MGKEHKKARKHEKKQQRDAEDMETQYAKMDEDVRATLETLACAITIVQALRAAGSPSGGVMYAHDTGCVEARVPTLEPFRCGRIRRGIDPESFGSLATSAQALLDIDGFPPSATARVHAQVERLLGACLDSLPPVPSHRDVLMPAISE